MEERTKKYPNLKKRRQSNRNDWAWVKERGRNSMCICLSVVELWGGGGWFECKELIMDEMAKNISSWQINASNCSEGVPMENSVLYSLCTSTYCVLLDRNALIDSFNWNGYTHGECSSDRVTVWVSAWVREMCCENLIFKIESCMCTGHMSFHSVNMNLCSCKPQAYCDLLSFYCYSIRAIVRLDMPFLDVIQRLLLFFRSSSIQFRN